MFHFRRLVPPQEQGMKSTSNPLGDKAGILELEHQRKYLFSFMVPGLQSLRQFDAREGKQLRSDVLKGW
jgi:hypothetical protein